MTIKKQKILKFIPLIQLATMFCWIKHYLAMHLPWSEFAKSMLKMFGVLLLIHLPRLILHFIFKNEMLDNIVYYISLYPTFLGIATIAVADQEQHQGNQ